MFFCVRALFSSIIVFICFRSSSISSFLFWLDLDLDRLDLDEALEDELDPELDLSRRRDLDLELDDSLLRLLLLDLDLALLLLCPSLMKKI